MSTFFFLSAFFFFRPASASAISEALPAGTSSALPLLMQTIASNSTSCTGDVASSSSLAQFLLAAMFANASLAFLSMSCCLRSFKASAFTAARLGAAALPQVERPAGTGAVPAGSPGNDSASLPSNLADSCGSWALGLTQSSMEIALGFAAAVVARPPAVLWLGPPLLLLLAAAPHLISAASAAAADVPPPRLGKSCPSVFGGEAGAVGADLDTPAAPPCGA
eukprot:CAMPEP_0172746928 /NCGR_PEP_ID=MMETSP1074-20121228/141678_1 /TAXON_ID=2916 /ORGANISM="Ceratium fusus, Strain PA161109" /LENGTH=221 /DNA_ID=CAMNT_0013578367 /DNA_START=143 /DNA_END=805 /DNA_ORIENTATION=-